MPIQLPQAQQALERMDARMSYLQEMGDIAPALELLLRVQAEYARREPGVSRAMRDVAYNAVATEIERYVRNRLSGDKDQSSGDAGGS